MKDMSDSIRLSKDAAKKLVEYIDKRNMKQLDKVSKIIKEILK